MGRRTGDKIHHSYFALMNKWYEGWTLLNICISTICFKGFTSISMFSLLTLYFHQHTRFICVDLKWFFNQSYLFQWYWNFLIYEITFISFPITFTIPSYHNAFLQPCFDNMNSKVTTGSSKPNNLKGESQNNLMSGMCLSTHICHVDIARSQNW